MQLFDAGVTTTADPDLFNAFPSLTEEERAANEEYLDVTAEAHALDPDTDDYPGITPDHKLYNCGGCGRLLLAANLPGEQPRGFRVTGSDRLPPLRYGWWVVGARRLAQCAGCYVEERRSNRRHT